MFSTTEYQYTRDLVITNLNEDYDYYLCFTENSGNTSYNSSDYDVICYFSKAEIQKQGEYQYTFTDTADFIEFDSNSYGTNNTIQKIHTGTVNASTINIPNYEYIYSNCEGSTFDIVSDIKFNQDNNLAYNLDLNYAYLVLVLLILPVIVGFVHHFFYINNERG